MVDVVLQLGLCSSQNIMFGRGFVTLPTALPAIIIVLVLESDRSLNIDKIH